MKNQVKRKKVDTDRGKLTAVLVKDWNVGGYTSYFVEYPEAIAEGDTEEEAIINLKIIFYDMLKHELDNK